MIIWLFLLLFIIIDHYIYGLSDIIFMFGGWRVEGGCWRVEVGMELTDWYRVINV
jgi:hypothetical protein